MKTKIQVLITKCWDHIVNSNNILIHKIYLAIFLWLSQSMNGFSMQYVVDFFVCLMFH